MYSQLMNWTATVRVDGHTYSVLGNEFDFAFDAAIQTSVQHTATHAIFDCTAGPIDVTATFFPSENVNNPHAIAFYI